MDVYDYDEVYGFEGLGVEFFTQNVKLCTFVHILDIELKYPLYQSVYGENMSKTKLENSNPQGVERAGEGAFSPTPNDLARLKEELESELQLRLSLKKYYNTERFCDIVEYIIREVIKKHFNLDEKDIYVEYLDVVPNSHKLIESSESTEGQIILLEDIESTDRIIAQFNINNQSYVLWIIISYESRELQIGDIYMMRLLRPIYVKDIKIIDERC